MPILTTFPRRAGRGAGAGLLCLTLISACVPRTDESGQRESRAGEGRAETQGIRNTENIGYAGNAIADRLDGALDANDQRTQVLDQQLEALENP